MGELGNQREGKGEEAKGKRERGRGRGEAEEGKGKGKGKGKTRASSPVPPLPLFTFSLFLRACAELVALEFEIKTAAGKAKFTGGARDVATMFSQSFRNHATLDFSKRIGKCEVLH